MVLVVRESEGKSRDVGMTRLRRGSDTPLAAGRHVADSWPHLCWRQTNVQRARTAPEMIVPKGNPARLAVIT